MKKLFLIVFMVLGGLTCLKAQYVYTIKADSVKLTNCDSSELIIENHTQTVHGFLFNTGDGRTIFKKGIEKLNDSLYVIGADTLKTAVHPWVQGGNAFGTTGILGTMDNNHLDFYSSGNQKMRLTNTGNLLLGTATDAGYKFNCNGTANITGVIIANSGAAFLNYVNFAGNSSQNIIYANVLTFNTNNALGNNNPNGIYTFTNQLPAANSGGGSFRLINVNKVVNRGQEDGEETAMRVDFTVTGTAGDLRALDAAHGNVVVETGNVVVGVATGSTSKVDITGANGYSQLRIRTQYTPSSSSDANGNRGDIAVDDNYLYYKTSTGWKRVALSTF
jgi:hypothetical protein